MDEGLKKKIYKDLKRLSYRQEIELIEKYGATMYNEVVEIIKWLIDMFRTDKKFKPMGEIEFNSDYTKVRKI